MPQYTINKKTFSGASKVYDGTLAGIIISLAQNQAITAAAAVTPLTDNGGGAANGTIEAVPVLVNHALVGSDSVAKADAENAFGTALNAISEVIYQINRVRTAVPAFPALIDNTGGAAATGTVAAITQTVAGANAALVSASGAISVFESLVDAIFQATVFVNRLADAVGVSQIAIPASESALLVGTFAPINLSTGGAVSGADALTHATIQATAFDAALVWLANSVKELTTKLHAITSGAPTIEVIVQ